MESTRLQVNTIFSAMIALTMATTSVHCFETHCDSRVGICLHWLGTKAESFQDARDQCRRNRTILLEIHDDDYKAVVEEAFFKWDELVGWWLLFGLEYKDEQFRWLTTGMNVSIRMSGMNQFNGTCNSFLVWDPWELRVEPSCGDDAKKNHYFVCLQDGNFREASTLTSRSFDPTVSMVTDGNIRQDSHHNFELLRNVAIAFGISVALIAINAVIYFAFIRTSRQKPERRPSPRTGGSGRTDGVSSVSAEMYEQLLAGGSAERKPYEDLHAGNASHAR